jgi:hypothetical protein
MIFVLGIIAFVAFCMCAMIAIPSEGRQHKMVLIIATSFSAGVFLSLKHKDTLTDLFLISFVCIGALILYYKSLPPCEKFQKEVREKFNSIYTRYKPEEQQFWDEISDSMWYACLRLTEKEDTLSTDLAVKKTIVNFLEKRFERDKYLPQRLLILKSSLEIDIAETKDSLKK